jgi:hypothetical protein
VVEPSSPTTVKKRRLLGRIPTSVVVTLLGIALTAWLLPALTRQWDDRQKAHDLDAALVSQISVSTGSAMSDIEQLQLADDPARRAAAVRAWTRTSLAIKSRLDAYFSKEVAATWALYSFGVGQMLGTRGILSDQTLGQAVGPRFNGTKFVNDPLTTDLVNDLLVLDRSSRQPTLNGVDRFDLQDLHRFLKLQAPDRGVSLAEARTRTERSLLLTESLINEALLSEHARGYSTTTLDLLHDLIPGT